ncbi:FliG C-terminal domain-containing protein [Hyphomicrobium sp. CS1GBMeth3]|uniref:FliG C-terminal domain-containing protein n=1 Tax=Hyphomicrobium sp. CS1GBMeth3 TaxID=1892845 RepID=UPI0009308E2C|nr:FliG C-terminal domain-containing protein [Hyphomicrobium sp. CS1GBMeth3]
MTGTSKAAAILLALNKETAGRVLKFFDEDEVKVIVQAINDLGSISREAVDKLIEVFADDIKGGVDLTANAKKIHDLLEGVLSSEQIEALLSQTGTKSAHAVWQQLAKIPDAVLAKYLQNEHPQVVALVLSRAELPTAAHLLAQFPRKEANVVVQRMLALRPVEERPLVLLEISLVQDVLLNRRNNSDQSPHTRLAHIINKMDRKMMEESVGSIAAHNEKDAELIRQQLFTFLDLDRLTDQSLTTVFDAMQPDTIIHALVGIPSHLTDRILAALPARAQRVIKSELENGVSPKPKEIQKAQRVIADAALVMLERGDIEIQHEGESDGPD